MKAGEPIANTERIHNLRYTESDTKGLQTREQKGRQEDSSKHFILRYFQRKRSDGKEEIEEAIQPCEICAQPILDSEYFLKSSPSQNAASSYHVECVKNEFYRFRIE